MSHVRRHRVESINFSYSLDDFAEDWQGVRNADEQASASDEQPNHPAVFSAGKRLTVTADRTRLNGGVSPWFIERYGDDPDHLYARYMRFTMVADVFDEYETEIRKAGLTLKNGYCSELLPLLLQLRVRPDEHHFARFDSAEVVSAIRRAAAVLKDANRA